MYKKYYKNIQISNPSPATTILSVKLSHGGRRGNYTEKQEEAAAKVEGKQILQDR
jgi:hypothetical protein